MNANVILYGAVVRDNGYYYITAALIFITQAKRYATSVPVHKLNIKRSAGCRYRETHGYAFRYEYSCYVVQDHTQTRTALQVETGKVLTQILTYFNALKVLGCA